MSNIELEVNQYLQAHPRKEIIVVPFCACLLTLDLLQGSQCVKIKIMKLIYIGRIPGLR